MRTIRPFGLLLLIAATVVLPATPLGAQTALDTIRTGVRQVLPRAAVETSQDDRRETVTASPYSSSQQEAIDEWNSAVFKGVVCLAWYPATSPYWVPRIFLNDGNVEATFPRYPYDQSRGYLVSRYWPDSYLGKEPMPNTLWSPRPDGPLGDSEVTPLPSTETDSTLPSLPSRRWGGQFRADYGDEFADLSSVSGQLILESTSRFGFDASFEHLRERLPGDSRDDLTLGDWNVVYRVAQSSWAQVRMGAGMNWMTDPNQTDVGFNFTYGADLFPRKPWVVSTAIDWGTLGHAELFRFRATAGVMISRWEAYTGYEYLDVGTTQSSSLIAGLRVWF